MKDIGISLTQFIDFTLKRSGSSKTKFVRDIKYNEYSPAKDYWKQLRDEIKRIHESKLSLNELDSLVEIVSERKKLNYKNAIRLYKTFLKDKNYEWFDPGNSFWTFQDELVVRSTPEIGLFIDNNPYLIKLYFKGKNDRIDQNNMNSSLTLMKASKFEKDLPVNSQSSVLNIYRKKLFANPPIDPDLLLSLESEASQFVFLWKQV